MSPLRGENPERPTYQILGKLGDGRGDDVYRASHEIFGGQWVQKTVRMFGLDDALASSEPAFLNRLEHSRIVPVREAQWDPIGPQAITFVMPLLEGGSVEEALKEDYRFSVHECLAIACDALDALGYIHRTFKAVHRDTKPGNVVLEAGRRRGLLSDFGSAAQMDADGRAAAVLGTHIYRPPESKSVGVVGVDADLYGIAMMLFEMLSGRIAWETMDLAAMEKRLQKGLRALPDAQLSFGPQVPPRLKTCIRKALNRKPEDRYASAAAFITALRRIRCVDWRHIDDHGLEGVWIGSWPPQLAESSRTLYRVAARKLEGGPDRGCLRVETHFCLPGGKWRQAVAPRTLDAEDSAGLAAVFVAVEANAAQRAPAR